MFVVTTIFDREDGKRIVHSWGPFESRDKAKSAIRTMKREDAQAFDDGYITVRGKVTYHTGEVMDPHTPPMVELSQESARDARESCELSPRRLTEMG